MDIKYNSDIGASKGLMGPCFYSAVVPRATRQSICLFRGPHVQKLVGCRKRPAFIPRENERAEIEQQSNELVLSHFGNVKSTMICIHFNPRAAHSTIFFHVHLL